MKGCIQIFAKAPVPGKVKTRMQPELDSNQCADLAKKLLHHSCHMAKEYGDTEVQLWCAPDTRHSYFQQLAEDFSLTLFAQQGEHLGQRMIHALNCALDSGLHPMLIGADCPFIDNEYLDAGFAYLEQHDVVLGPATDGGYVLIGSRKILPKNGFEGIDWGTKNVLQQTVQQVGECGLSYGLLRPLADIDRYQDLELLDACLSNLL
jgi:uncharacterized protein